MASKVDIANRALIKLGSNTISSLTEQDPGAKVIASNWEMIRRDELMKNVWYFAKRSANLAATAETPDYWNFQYKRLADDIKLVEIGRDQNWAAYGRTRYYDLQGDLILTDMQPPLRLTYVSDVTNTGNFHSAFAECLAARHALEACMAVTGSNTLLASMYDWYSQVLAAAKRQDAIQTAPQIIGGREPWVAARKASVQTSGWWN